MPFVAQAVAEAKEQELAEEAKYDLRCIKADFGRNKANTRNLVTCVILIESEDDTEYAPIMHWMSIEKEDDEPSTKEMMIRDNRRFLDAFSIPFTDAGFDTDDFINATASQITVKKEERNDMPGEFANRLALPPIESEEAEDKSAGKKTRRRRSA